MKEETRSEQPSFAKATDDKQEWTHEKLQGLLGISNEDRYVADHAFENTLDELNAALAAERQRREQAEEWKDNVLSKIKLIPEYTTGQWGGDKEGWGFCFELIGWQTRELANVRQQLLSALAVIEKHNSDHVDDTFCCIDVDPSMLHLHDAEKATEVRKPLVDLLRWFVAECKAGTYVVGSTLDNKLQEADAALAQCKP